MEKDQIIKAIDILEKFDFLQGQRAGRELWNGKPFEVQEQDISNFSSNVNWLIGFIKEQDEQIFKLENRLKECENGYSQTLALERAKVKELSGINYKSVVTLIKEHYKTVEMVVILFRDRLRERIKGVYLDEGEMCAIIDEVAGKILNGNTEDK